MPQNRLRGQTALITGAGMRLGREMALALAQEDVNVVVHYRQSQDQAQKLTRELQGIGVKSWLVQADLSVESEYETLITQTLDLTGSLDILINSASIFPADTLDSLTLEKFTRDLEVNAWAPFSLSRQFAQQVGRGMIINLLDTRIFSYDWKHVGYILSKHLLYVLTQMMALKYAPNIAVNGIAPGLILPPPGQDMNYLESLVNTVPLRRHGDPGDVAATVLFLLKSDFITGTVIEVDGGRHLLGYTHGPNPD